MRIYIVGSHTVGKSTLARYVSQKYNLTFLPEVARQILAEQELQIDTLRSNLDVVDDFQSKIFYRQIEQEKKYTDFVSDRSLDCLAYAAQHSRVLPALLKSTELQQYLTALKQEDVFIFFVRPSKVTLKDDGVRETLTWDGIIAIDAQVKLLFEMFELKYFQINTDSMQERVKLIESILNR